MEQMSLPWWGSGTVRWRAGPVAPRPSGGARWDQEKKLDFFFYFLSIILNKKNCLKILYNFLNTFFSSNFLSINIHTPKLNKQIP
jgi:hypothetical protein